MQQKIREKYTLIWTTGFVQIDQGLHKFAVPRPTSNAQYKLNTPKPELTTMIEGGGPLPPLSTAPYQAGSTSLAQARLSEQFIIRQWHTLTT